MKKLKGACKDCLYGCNRLEIETFEGVQKCEYCTLEEIIVEQIKMEGLDE